MIRPEVATRVQPTADLALRPALPAQEITDKLPGLVAGQRLLAEIQSLMPNGTYRALINQRSVTLALPFAAKSGDAIELEVAESNGKLTLAVIARASSDGGKAGGESTAASLSRTGQLISNLLVGTRDGKGNTAVPLALNGNQPIAPGPVSNGPALVPLLRQAIVQSGMFYEAHQAEWVEGRYSKAQLLQEPQGRLPPTASQQEQGAKANSDAGNMARTAAGNAPTPFGAADTAGKSQAPPLATPSSQPAPVLIAPQTHPVVQQQLEAFATQNFSWQGQVWPGQQVHWEIENESKGNEHGGDDNGEKWQTRLRLALPGLGEVEARLHIRGQQLALTLTAGNAETRLLLSSEASGLRSQLEKAGLGLSSLGVSAPREAGTNAQGNG